MRPVRLQVEGFTCYRERQTPLVFEGLTLFAIAGPTGAGKSSVLDAILFALYGQVPRIGKQGFADFISQGRDALAVTLDFLVRGTTYRVARKVKRNRTGGLTTTAILEEVGPPPRAIADQVRPVNDAIVRLLGLDFSAFTQTVILPQGEFAKFLKADPKDQRGILQHLLRHEVYERMREEAERRKRDADQAVQVLERALAASGDATPEALALERTRLEGRHRELAELGVLKDTRERSLVALRAQRQLTIEVQGLRTRREALDARATAIESKRTELNAARAAGGVVPRVEAAREASGRFAELTRARAEAERTAAAGSADVAESEARLTQAVAAAGEIEPLSLRIRALDEIKGDLDRRDALTTSLDASRQAVPATRRRAQETAAALGQARDAQRTAEGALAHAQAALAACVFDPADEQRLHDVWDTAVRLRATLDDEDTLAGRHAACEATVASAQGALAAVDTALKAAAREVAAAATIERDSVAAREAGRTVHQAAALREHLHAGDACPVCLQTVVLLPPQARAPELEQLDRQLDAARAHVAAVARVQQEAAEKRASAQAQLQAAEQARDEAAGARQEKAARRREAVAIIAAGIAGAVAGDDLAQTRALIATLESRRTAMRQARQAHDRVHAVVRTAEASCAAADLACVQAEAAAATAAGALDRLIEEGTRVKADLDQVAARIAAVSTHENPALEREQLARRVAALDAAQRDAEGRLARARSANASAQASLTAAAAAALHATEAEATARQGLDDALRAGGFASVDAVLQAVRTSAQQATIEADIRRHEGDLAAVTTRLLELEPQAAGHEVLEATVMAADAECQDAVRAWRAADVDCATLAAAITRLESDVERRQAEQAELARALDGRNLLTGMAADLKSSAFQEYLLEEAFRALVAGASVRMRQMSGRYTLDWREGAFYVVDHDNAGEQRRAETLSGGETFMASLCLALQLSDEVLKTSGALQMDSLFIDEGFGTLDADALAEVIDAMEVLQADGARLVGVISHRPELTERLPGCIRVTKGAGESTWALDRVS